MFVDMDLCDILGLKITAQEIRVDPASFIRKSPLQDEPSTNSPLMSPLTPTLERTTERVEATDIYPLNIAICPMLI